MRIQTMIFAAVVCLAWAAMGQDSASPSQQELPKRVRVSEKVTKILLTKKVEPEYPDEARKKHVTGTVIMKAVISPEGDVQEVTVLSGDPLLAPSASQAAKQWKYKPYLLQGHPVEVETQITMTFSLSPS